MKYGTLHTIAAVFNVLASILLVVGVICSIYIGIARVEDISVRAGVFVIIVGLITLVLYFLLLLVSAQLIYLFLDIEQHTRETAERLKQKSSE